MLLIKKRSKILLVLITVFWGLVGQPLPSFGSGNTAWELSKAFGEAMRYQESANKNVFYFLMFSILLSGIIIFRYVMQLRRINNQKKESQPWEHDIPEKGFISGSERSWVRLSVNQDILFSRDGNDNYEKGKVLNMSGGGLLLATEQALKLNDQIKILLELEPGKKLKLAGEVVRVLSSSNNADKVNLFGVEFINIKRGEQDSIMKKILTKQQESVTAVKRPH